MSAPTRAGAASVLQPLHIDVARNATDDFNPFHDKTRWRQVEGNPFAGPIALGFQLGLFVEDALRRFRTANDEHALIARDGLRYSNYQFTFAAAAAAGDALSVEVRPSRYRERTLANRVTVRKPGAIVLTGHKKETAEPLRPLGPPGLPPLRAAVDRREVGDSGYFLKRKYLTTANAKNFLVGAMVEQSDYFDELADRVRFPELYPAALISCALLERATLAGHDFIREPVVYTSHAISVDRERCARLASNDALHVLVADRGGWVYDCFGVVNDDAPLFGAQIRMAPLAEVAGAHARRRHARR